MRSVKVPCWTGPTQPQPLDARPPSTNQPSTFFLRRRRRRLRRFLLLGEHIFRILAVFSAQNRAVDRWWTSSTSLGLASRRQLSLVSTTQRHWQSGRGAGRRYEAVGELSGCNVLSVEGVQDFHPVPCCCLTACEDDGERRCRYRCHVVCSIGGIGSLAGARGTISGCQRQSWCCAMGVSSRVTGQTSFIVPRCDAVGVVKAASSSSSSVVAIPFSFLHSQVLVRRG